VTGIVPFLLMGIRDHPAAAWRQQTRRTMKIAVARDNYPGRHRIDGAHEICGMLAGTA
jgi:hypothetical protein